MTISLPLLQTFLTQQHDLESYRSGKETVAIDGKTLSIAAVASVARFHAHVELDNSPATRDAVLRARQVVEDQVASGRSVYGISTGFGGSADTRTDHHYHLGLSLVQHLHVGVLPSSSTPLGSLPLSDPVSATSMPESWVRAAMLVRINSLIRGHSGVRWEIIERISELLEAKITPFVPLRTSISASGDLSPLSYIAGSVMGLPSIRVFDGPDTFGPRSISSAGDALKRHGIEKICLEPKEGLGIVNGTAFAAGVAALALNDSVHLALFAHVLTAMSSEALLGTRCNFDQFIHSVCRPHPGQIESAQLVWDLLDGSKLVHMHEDNISLSDDKYALRQDRYALRTAPQFLGPQLEDILAAHATVTLECNSTTDNPLVESAKGIFHHGGNFQAMSVTNAMEKTRLSLHHIGKILFAQGTEILNPAINHGLPPSVCATDPSLNYHAKGLDVALAAYVSELGYLANPVSTHIQSAEMHNQAVNSLALISARATINSLETLMLLMSSHLYILCQAMDLRALQTELLIGLDSIISKQLSTRFTKFGPEAQEILRTEVLKACHVTFDSTNTMDGLDRMRAVAAAAVPLILKASYRELAPSDQVITVTAMEAFESEVSEPAFALLQKLRHEYLSGARGSAPAKHLLGRTKSIYLYVRETLGVKMHGIENLDTFSEGLYYADQTIGQNVSLIYEAIRDGKMQSMVSQLLSDSCSSTLNPLPKMNGHAKHC